MKTATEKTAKITCIMAISVTCKDCGEFCEDHYGSTMITDESETVTCRFCHTVYTLPQDAFMVMSKRKCKVVEPA